jgi:hypothetical protein
MVLIGRAFEHRSHFTSDAFMAALNAEVGDRAVAVVSGEPKPFPPKSA